MGYILAIDQGTTGTTSLLIDSKSFALTAKFNKEYPQIYPKPGWVEHNLNDIWESVSATVSGVLKKAAVDAKQIEAIGITNQRETICAFHKNGNPVRNAIVWQDRRTHVFCESLKSNGKSKLIQNKTGLPIDPYFSGSKIHWLINNDEEIAKAISQNDLFFGNIDTFLLYKLTSGESYFTETTNASRTLLMNIQSCSWDQELLDIFNTSKNNLPEIKNSIDKFGVTKGLSFLPDGIPITGILGDQQAALFGQAGFDKGSMKCTYGTGAFILLNTGEVIQRSERGLLSTIAYSYNGRTNYAVEGSSYIAGAAVQWLRDNLNIISSSPEIEELAQKIDSLEQMEHITLLPFFTGIGSPYWKSEAKAAIVGLTRDSGKAHLARACLEGIALSINDLIEAMVIDMGENVHELRVDGGAASNNLLMKIQATFSNLKIVRPQVIETTAYGAALAAGIGLERLDFDSIKKLWNEDCTFTPDKNNASYYNNKKAIWKDLISRLYL